MLILLITIVSFCVPSVEPRYDWSHLVAQSVIWQWNKIVKMMRMHHFHLEDWEWHLHTSVSGSSESSSESSSSERRSGSVPASGRKFREQSSRRPADSQQQMQHDFANMVGIATEEERPLVVQAFMFFVTNWGCHNVSGFEHFFAAYNSESQEDAMITMNDQHELLREMSSLAQNDLKASPDTGNSTPG